MALARLITIKCYKYDCYLFSQNYLEIKNMEAMIQVDQRIRPCFIERNSEYLVVYKCLMTYFFKTVNIYLFFLCCLECNIPVALMVTTKLYPLSSGDWRQNHLSISKSITGNTLNKHEWLKLAIHILSDKEEKHCAKS